MPIGKAPGPDPILNEVIKYLPDLTHNLIYTLFAIMAILSYLLIACCTSATIYKPKIKYPNSLTNYILIAVMNCIL